jgi:hypothetical protein
MLDMGWMLEKTENPQRRPGWGLTNFSFGVSDAWASEYMGLEVLPTHFFFSAGRLGWAKKCTNSWSLIY